MMMKIKLGILEKRWWKNGFVFVLNAYVKCVW